MTPRLRSAWPLLLSLLACQPTGEQGADDLATLSSRLEATEQRLAAIETKLDAMTTTLDKAIVAFEPVSAWAAAHKAENEEKEARRKEREERRGEPRPSRLDDDYDRHTTHSREIEGAVEAIECDEADPSSARCRVQRAFIDRLVADPGLLAKQARIVPSARDGVTQGFKLYAIRPGSLPKLLGLKNGDMVTAINGDDLNSIDKAMEIYTKLRRAKSLRVELERKGTPFVLTIEIVE